MCSAHPWLCANPVLVPISNRYPVPSEYSICKFCTLLHDQDPIAVDCYMRACMTEDAHRRLSIFSGLISEVDRSRSDGTPRPSGRGPTDSTHLSIKS